MKIQDGDPRGFGDLFAAERKWRRQPVAATPSSRGAGGAGFAVSSVGSADAPRVTFTEEDCVGLAFSGGGIRSATFNLGVLQGLHRLKFLRHIDYLATVSGGGYIGAWWSAWLARRPRSDVLFPETEAAEPEPEEVRHLREFSNFLAPRIGFFETETWAAVLAVLSAMAPTLCIALSIIALAILAWLLAAAGILAPDWRGPIVMLALLAAAQVACELRWRRSARAEKCTGIWAWWTGATLAVLAAAWVAWRVFEGAVLLFLPALSWLGAAALGFGVRIVVFKIFRGENFREKIAALDRVLQRTIASAVVWSIGGGIWLVGEWLHEQHTGQGATAGGAILSGGVFALLRNWMAEQLSARKKGGLLEVLKPMLPQLLALIALTLAAICLAAGIAAGLEWKSTRFFAAAVGGAVAVIAGTAWLFDPAMVSMHAFYRNRLARAYLGASNERALPEDARHNRFIEVRGGDDIAMRELLPSLPGPKIGPLHLVCCAANDVGGDQLGNLSRAARSAVLSPLGFQIDDAWRAWGSEPGKKSPTHIDRLTLSSAITASAAAFNSNMGSLSAQLGALVCFLMSALNLRLGLWLPHPRSGREDLGFFPGWLFLKEMFADTRCGLEKGKPISPYVHLSDGAHFENLALYELVRRHCRYIIVSDCGADSTVAFDDFGNAMRRIREDFGVEIDIDLEPLRPDPATRLSRQHMAVGAIYYDRARDDTGILLFIKPTLTGDEPCDVAQYRTRNAAFPHESTGDQFYDEAQWESYRRLGEHAIQAALRFAERMGALHTLSADRVFTGARQEWYPAPPGLGERVVEATDRVGELEARLRAEAPASLRYELFPELREMERAFPSGSSEPAPPMSRAQEIESSLPFILEIFRIMQSVWLSCRFDTHWGHPLNLGLLNLFQRWAYAPSCRLWWPLLRPLHGDRFRRFMEEHLALADRDHPRVEGKVAAMTAERQSRGESPEIPDGLAKLHWLRSRAPRDAPPADAIFCEYTIGLPLQTDGTAKLDTVQMQLGLAAVVMSGSVARWHSDDFFVPPGLWGSGIGADFLEKLIAALPPATRCEVELARELPGEQRNDFASRQERNDLVSFYKRAGFALDAAGHLTRAAQS